MKTKTLAGFVVVLKLLGSISLAAPLGTEFTYQGRLTDGGHLANGTYDFRFAIYDAAGGSSPFAGPVTNSAVVVNDGLFATALHFGDDVFTGAERWLEIGVRDGGSTGPFEVLEARHRLTSTPYAITAGHLTGTLSTTQLTGAISSAQLSGTYSAELTFDNPANRLAGDGARLTGLNASALSGGTVPDARLGAGVARTSQVWLLSGNAGTSPSTHFLGTTDDQPFELRAHGLRGLLLQPGRNNSVNLVGGWVGNHVTPGVEGATIGGGGGNWPGSSFSNSVEASFGTISGGLGNRIGADASAAVVGGGNENLILSNSFNATIAGGLRNTIQADAYNAGIGGGSHNVIQNDAVYATIAGGSFNTNHVRYGSIGGGSANAIEANAHWAIIGGGRNNLIGEGAFDATIGGGSANAIQGSAAQGVISGGRANELGADLAVIGGGHLNAIRPGATRATIAGGWRNTIETEAQWAAIGGGTGNTINSNAIFATIGGGWNNIIEAGAERTTIGGGEGNVIQAGATAAFVGAGLRNVIASNAALGTIDGGWANHIETNVGLAVIGGGFGNRVTADFGVIAGGGRSYSLEGNLVSDEGGFVGGGARNHAGNANDVVTDAYYATVAGGWDNQAGGKYASVPGGLQNRAMGDLSFAAGRRARAEHAGALVWGDATDAEITSAGANSVTFRAAGGYRLFSDSSATVGVELAAGSGTWTMLSDRNAKTAFAAVDSVGILEQLLALPITTWRYTTQSESVRHLGPVAQDFKAAFDIGESDTGIACVDADGVALAAIQGLNRKFEERLQQKDAKIAKLERDLTELRSLVRRALNNSLPP